MPRKGKKQHNKSAASSNLIQKTEVSSHKNSKISDAITAENNQSLLTNDIDTGRYTSVDHNQVHPKQLLSVLPQIIESKREPVSTSLIASDISIHASQCTVQPPSLTQSNLLIHHTTQSESIIVVQPNIPIHQSLDSTQLISRCTTPNYSIPTHQSVQTTDTNARSNDILIPSCQVLNTVVIKDNSNTSDIILPITPTTELQSELEGTESYNLSVKDMLQGQISQYLVHESGGHYIYSLPSEIIIIWNTESSLKKWIGNRDPDIQRVLIIKDYHKQKQHVHGTINLAYLNGSLVCYEGNHRRLSLIPGIRILVDILWDAEEEDIMDEFMAINQQISVSTICTDTTLKEEIKDKIKRFVDDELIAKYGGKGGFQSFNPTCNKPNFIRDAVQTQIHSMYTNINCDLDQLLRAILSYNEYCRQTGGKHIYATQGQKDKCIKGQLWLFLEYQGRLNEDAIRKYL